jgi:cytoskeletal protein CcmA (bactofilin family)
MNLLTPRQRPAAKPIPMGSENPAFSVIGSDIVITGNIEATVDLHIEGRVEGDVRCATLFLGDASTIKGKVIADRVRIAGTVEGSIETKDLAIEATAKVNGNINYERLRVASGGQIDGTLKCKADPSKLKLVENEG